MRAWYMLIEIYSILFAHSFPLFILECRTIWWMKRSDVEPVIRRNGARALVRVHLLTFTLPRMKNKIIWNENWCLCVCVCLFYKLRIDCSYASTLNNLYATQKYSTRKKNSHVLSILRPFSLSLSLTRTRSRQVALNISYLIIRFAGHRSMYDHIESCYCLLVHFNITSSHAPSALIRWLIVWMARVTNRVHTITTT